MILDFLFSKPKGTGALIDNRPQELKDKDYTLRELVSSVNPVTWTEKPQSSWRKFPIFDQNGSGSCVAQTLAKLLGILYWLKNGEYVHFSATHIYQQRANKPSAGMGGVDAFDIARKGVTLEVLVPSQKMTDSQMDSVKIDKYKADVGSVFKVPNYVVDPVAAIDTIASIIQTTGKGVMVWFFFEYPEWQNVPAVQNNGLTANQALRHSVAAVDFTLYKGKKAIIIEDSWGAGYGFSGQRVITEDFFKTRNFFAGHVMNFVFDEQSTPKPVHAFQKEMKFGMQDDEVKFLQDVLKYEGFFPINTDSTGYYGAVTADAVLKFQQKYKVDKPDVLIQLAGKTVGQKTLAKLNELYAQ